LKTGVFRNASGEESFFRHWPAGANGGVRAVVLLVHGLGEHSGRYGHVAEHLSARRFSVFSYDHRGHGLSPGRRGWIGEYREFLEDLERFHELVVEACPGRPVVLLGHSMGGLIVTTYLLEKPRRPDFLVLSGPAIVPILDPNDRTIDPTRLSKDPAVWDAYLNDPIILRERVDPELFVRLAEGVALLPGRATEISVPVLLLHGDDDRLCSAEGAKYYVEASSSSDITVKLYPGGRHEMFNETNRDEVLEDLSSWLEARTE
jgi:alpha-beta hydrolase superfamily lysophospholipase